MSTSQADREAEKYVRQLYVLTEVAKTLTTALDLPELLRTVMAKLSTILEPAEMGLLMLWDQSSGIFRPAAAFGYDFEVLGGMGLRAGESITGKVFDEGVACLFSTPDEVAQAMADMRPANRKALARALGTDALPRSAVAAPLQVGDRKFGVLTFLTLHSLTGFSQDNLSFLQTLADLIALAIDRARLEAQADVIRDTRQADRLRSEAMATLSHELRTPLAAIKGYSTALLLREIEWPEDKRREFLRLIDEECDNMQTMIGDISDSALLDIGQLTIESEPVRLERIARELVDDVQRRTEIHRLVLDFPPDFPLIDADPHRIRQVLRNILDNAVKYSPDGGLVVVRGEVRPADVVISISDQGVGISSQDLIPLFEKYFRVKSPNGHHVAGTGLGLPVARAIVEAHDGRIWAESTVGEGTTLYFSLPRAGLSAEAD